MPKATAIFDADDSHLSGALARINGKMLALQSRIAKFAAECAHSPLADAGQFEAFAARARHETRSAQRK